VHEAIAVPDPCGKGRHPQQVLVDTSPPQLVQERPAGKQAHQVDGEPVRERGSQRHEVGCHQRGRVAVVVAPRAEQSLADQRHEQTGHLNGEQAGQWPGRIGRAQTGEGREELRVGVKGLEPLLRLDGTSLPVRHGSSCTFELIGAEFGGDNVGDHQGCETSGGAGGDSEPRGASAPHRQRAQCRRHDTAQTKDDIVGAKFGPNHGFANDAVAGHRVENQTADGQERVRQQAGQRDPTGSLAESRAETGGGIAPKHLGVSVGKVEETKDTEVLVNANGIFFGKQLGSPTRHLPLYRICYWT